MDASHLDPTQVRRASERRAYRRRHNLSLDDRRCQTCRRLQPAEQFRVPRGIERRSCIECEDERGARGEKYCAGPLCHRFRPLEDFATYLAQRAGTRGVQSRCRVCVSAERVTRLYGKTPAELRALKRAAGGTCEICRVRPATDIDHVENKDPAKRYRGWLCNGCNVSLGHCRDNPEILERAAVYLRTRP